MMPGQPAQRSSRAREQTASIHWDQVPLRDAVARASSVFGSDVFVDRRIDPTQRVTLHIEEATLDELLKSLADRHTLGTSRLGTLRYLGPPAAAEQLRTVAAVRSDEVSKLPAALEASLKRPVQLAWPQLTAPRGLIASAAQLRGWQIAQADRIPHDLWPANKLPALPASEQLTVLLIGFDLTFVLNPIKRTVEIVPLESETIQRRYPLDRRKKSLVDLLRASLPAKAVRIAGNAVVVEGRVEEHERVLELLGERAPQPSADESVRRGKQVYTLRVEEQPVGVILQQLATRLNWAIEIDEAAIESAGLSVDMRVSFAVENSSQDELLEAVLQPAGLGYRKEGDRIRIVPREE